MNKALRNTGIALLGVAVAGTVVAFMVRDQISRHRRDLFSPRAFRRLAALGHMAGEAATVDNINLMWDFISWEPRNLLRSRAKAIVQRMEIEAQAADETSSES